MPPRGSATTTRNLTTKERDTSDQITSQDILDGIRRLPAGTYTAWGIEFEGIYGTHLTPAPDRERAERYLAELLSGRGIQGRMVSRTVVVSDGGWQ